jgi:hypothetical protein
MRRRLVRLSLSVALPMSTAERRVLVVTRADTRIAPVRVTVV